MGIGTETWNRLDDLACSCDVGCFEGYVEHGGDGGSLAGRHNLTEIYPKVSNNGTVSRCMKQSLVMYSLLNFIVILGEGRDDEWVRERMHAAWDAPFVEVHVMTTAGLSTRSRFRTFELSTRSGTVELQTTLRKCPLKK